MAHRPKVSRLVRRAVYERDNWTCQECGREVPPQNDDERRGKKAPVFSDPRLGVQWLEIDHVTPYSAGSPAAVDTCRALCSPCNRVKSDSTFHADWPARVALAQKILAELPASESTARRAVAALTGSSEGIRFARQEVWEERS